MNNLTKNVVFLTVYFSLVWWFSTLAGEYRTMRTLGHVVKPDSKIVSLFTLYFL